MSTFSPRISIVIPVYNGANYLRLAIESALAQKYAAAEILVINDGSTDGGQTRAIALEYGPRIRYIEQENGGVAAALNTAIREMTGDYFSWLSHDDLYTSDKLSAQVAALAERPSDERLNTVVYSEWKTIDKDGYPLGRVQFLNRFSAEKLSIPLFPLFNGLLHGCTLLIPVRLLRQVGGFDTSLRTTQDFDCWLKILRHARVLLVPKALVLSRVHREQGSKKIKDHLSQSDALWNSMLGSLSSEERVQMEGSEDAFFRKFIEFCRLQGYQRALMGLIEQMAPQRIQRRAGVRVSPGDVASTLASLPPNVDVFLEPLEASEQAQQQRQFPHLKLQFLPADSIGPAVLAAGVEALFYLRGGDMLTAEQMNQQMHIADALNVEWTASGESDPLVMIRITQDLKHIPHPQELSAFVKTHRGFSLVNPASSSASNSIYRKVAAYIYKRSGAVFLHHWGRDLISGRVHG